MTAQGSAIVLETTKVDTANVDPSVKSYRPSIKQTTVFTKRSTNDCT